jgi:pyruvate dehydrogenase E1 component alpha subunit
MCLCRRFEEAAAKAYSQGKISGFLHLYIGQEAVAVGAISGAAPTDYIGRHLREHATTSPHRRRARAMAELYGKATVAPAGAADRCTSSTRSAACSAAGRSSAATCRSRPGSRSPASTATRRRHLCFFGDGTANMGAFHEGPGARPRSGSSRRLHLREQPVRHGTPLYRTLAVEDVSVRARGYPMKADIVNGDDVLEMREATQHAVERARKDKLPFFLEAKTYRFRGHSVADPAKYRTKEEVKKWMERDPI